MDAQIFTAIHRYAGKSKFLDSFGIFCAEILPFVMIGALGWLSFMPNTSYDWELFAEVTVSVSIAVLTTRTLKVLFGRQRPPKNISVKSIPLVTTNIIHAFPSGHSAFAFAIAASAFLITTPLIGSFFIVAAILVAIGRVYVGVHWPSDILGGAIVGALSAIAIRYFIELM